MSLILHIVISLFLIGAIVYEIVKLTFLKKEKAAIISRIASYVSIIFGLYLWLNYGLILDYGTEEEKITKRADLMYWLGVTDIAIGFFFLAFLYIKYLISIIRRP